jgi:dTDP-4-amino-4,6-dideoxygalactose transaminase
MKYQTQDKLAAYFGKKYGEFLYSGTLALELALKSAHIQSGDCVLLPDNVCYRILLSVVKVGAKPIIVSPKNTYLVDKSDIEKAIKNYSIKAIILVHHYGLPLNIKLFRKICPKNIVLIEDAAQSWQMKSAGKKIGKYSDYVITSFGATKPLSLGIGGAIFSDKKEFREFLDNYDRDSREKSQEILPYVLPKSININLDKLIEIGNKNVAYQRLVANCLIKGLEAAPFNYWQTQRGDLPSWHRFPIWTDDKELYEKALKMAEIYQISYELPHKLSLDKLPLARANKSIHMENTGKKYYHIIIKPRQNSLTRIQKWLKAIK